MTKENLINSLRAFSWSMLLAVVNRVAPKVVFIILLILLAQTFAELAWLFFADSKDTTITKNVAPSTLNRKTPNRQVQLANLNQVARYHLFGKAKSQGQPIQQKIIDAPDTRLHLVLKGVFASTNTKKTLAIIGTQKGKGKSYRVGDKLSGGALLHAVYSDRVILKRNNKLETLRLPSSSIKDL